MKLNGQYNSQNWANLTKKKQGHLQAAVNVRDVEEAEPELLRCEKKMSLHQRLNARKRKSMIHG